MFDICSRKYLVKVTTGVDKLTWHASGCYYNTTLAVLPSAGNVT